MLQTPANRTGDETMSLTASPTVLTGQYRLDPTHSRVGFVARHAMVTKVRGSFNEVEGSGYFDAENPASSRLDLTIKAHSIDTRNADRDAHLRSNDFFDMDTYPEIRFVSTSVEKVDDDNFQVTGDLTVKDVTRPVTLDFEVTGVALDPWGNQRLGLEGSTVINRKDWNVNFNVALDAGGVLVSDKITIEFEVSAVKEQASA
jgi:polyisoprenoid-binding protein YceI